MNLFSRFKRSAADPAASSPVPPINAPAPDVAKDDNADATRVLDRITMVCR